MCVSRPDIWISEDLWSETVYATVSFLLRYNIHLPVFVHFSTGFYLLLPVQVRMRRPVWPCLLLNVVLGVQNDVNIFTAHFCLPVCSFICMSSCVCVWMSACPTFSLPVRLDVFAHFVFFHKSNIFLLSKTSCLHVLRRSPGHLTYLLWTCWVSYAFFILPSEAA